MARRAVIVILDGLRRDMVGSRTTPNLAGNRADFTWFAAHSSVFPSTTRVAAACIATGRRPAHHGLFGNNVVLRHDGRLTCFDAGKPGFFEHMRRLTGAALRAPTLAERLAPHGGSIVLSNVSPGAAYAHDPDGHGHVYHRAGSYGPGGKPLDDDTSAAVAAGDRDMTDRFCDHVLRQSRPALAVLWLEDPDHTQHATPLGSQQHLAALKRADRCAGRVIETCAQLAADEGDDVLLIVGSDHGHHTVRREIDVQAALCKAGFGREIAEATLVVASNGGAALIYTDHMDATRQREVSAFLRGQDWAGDVYEGDALGSVGLSESDGLTIAINMRQYAEGNGFGIAGSSDVSVTAEDIGRRVGLGQHGGNGVYEQAPFLMIRGPGFAAGEARTAPSSLLDVAPTVLRHLDLAIDDSDGAPLQDTSDVR